MNYLTTYNILLIPFHNDVQYQSNNATKSTDDETSPTSVAISNADVAHMPSRLSNVDNKTQSVGPNGHRKRQCKEAQQCKTKKVSFI